MLQKFLAVNGELRRKNAEKIASYREAVVAGDPLGRRGVPSVHEHRGRSGVRRPADLRLQRQGRRPADAPRLRSRARRQLADRRRQQRQGACTPAPLGIYGNCVILDHGMGVQSLYGHLSSIGVKAGDTVEKEQELGKSGMTGLAGGDHLHFTMLVNGQMVNPVEWWDAHWIQDRIIRKLRKPLGRSVAGEPASNGCSPAKRVGVRVKSMHMDE